MVFTVKTRVGRILAMLPLLVSADPPAKTGDKRYGLYLRNQFMRLVFRAEAVHWLLARKLRTPEQPFHGPAFPAKGTASFCSVSASFL
jgi:hypothetical protein